jgi:hypothetical protein
MRHASLMLVGIAAAVISVSPASATMRITGDPVRGGARQRGTGCRPSADHCRDTGDRRNEYAGHRHDSERAQYSDANRAKGMAGCASPPGADTARSVNGPPGRAWSAKASLTIEERERPFSDGCDITSPDDGHCQSGDA